MNFGVVNFDDIRFQSSSGDPCAVLAPVSDILVLGIIEFEVRGKLPEVECFTY